ASPPASSNTRTSSAGRNNQRIMALLRTQTGAVGPAPAPGLRASGTLQNPLAVDVGHHVTVAGKQRLGRAHFRAGRQLAFSNAIGAIFGEFGLAVVFFRAAGAERALVHLAARAEGLLLRVLRRAERTGIEAVTAADAGVLVVQDDAVDCGVEAVGRADGGTGRVGAVHARH